MIWDLEALADGARIYYTKGGHFPPDCKEEDKIVSFGKVSLSTYDDKSTFMGKINTFLEGKEKLQAIQFIMKMIKYFS